MSVRSRLYDTFDYAPPKSTYVGVGAPTVNDDITEGYSQGSKWYDSVGGEIYYCVDNADGAAVWLITSFDPGDVATIAVSGELSDATDLGAISTDQVLQKTSGGWAGVTLAAVSFSGDYSDLVGTPNFATVALSGDYNDLINTPNLATVATTGDYNDLINTPGAPYNNIADDANNGLLVGDASTAGNVNFTAQGSLTNVDITFIPKGTSGKVRFGSDGSSTYIDSGEVVSGTGGGYASSMVMESQNLWAGISSNNIPNFKNGIASSLLTGGFGTMLSNSSNDTGATAITTFYSVLFDSATYQDPATRPLFAWRNNSGVLMEMDKDGNLDLQGNDLSAGMGLFSSSFGSTGDNQTIYLHGQSANGVNLGNIAFKDSAGGIITDGATYAQITAGRVFSTQGSLTFSTRSSSALTTTMIMADGNTTVLGAMVVGSPTGGNKGAGTINAQAVYDDNVLLTDYVFEKEFLGKPKDSRFNGFSRNSLLDELSFVKNNFHLSTMPSRQEWEKGKLSIGELINRLWQTIEIQFLYISEIYSNQS